MLYFCFIYSKCIHFVRKIRIFGTDKIVYVQYKNIVLMFVLICIVELDVTDDKDSQCLELKLLRLFLFSTSTEPKAHVSQLTLP